MGFVLSFEVWLHHSIGLDYVAYAHYVIQTVITVCDMIYTMENTNSDCCLYTIGIVTLIVYSDLLWKNRPFAIFHKN